jgi:glutamate 5-kinase
MAPAASNDSRSELESARRVVVKVGSAVLAPDGHVEPERIETLVDDLCAVRAGGRETVLVSSGAIACGFRALGLDEAPDRIVRKQAAAAIGQQRLMSLYADAFGRRGAEIGQVLLTSSDIEDRQRAVHARHTLAELLRCGCVPIVNENDTVSFEEIKVGDNDRLSALVAGLVGADLLVVLSVAPGLRADGGAGDVLERVSAIEEARVHVADDATAVGTGGMSTKLDAMQIATSCGTPGVVASGAEPCAVRRVLAGETLGTWFPAGRRVNARRGWIAHAARSEGAVHVDEGARAAIIERGASLLPAGVTSVAGAFADGAVVDVVAGNGTIIARGVASYGSSEIERIAGRSTREIETALGYRYCDEIIHRDDLIVGAAEGGAGA